MIKVGNACYEQVQGPGTCYIENDYAVHCTSCRDTHELVDGTCIEKLNIGVVIMGSILGVLGLVFIILIICCIIVCCQTRKPRYLGNIKRMGYSVK